MIGIKTSVDSFEYRQAIRETWLSQADPSTTCVLFCVGAPNSTLPSAPLLSAALRLEQSTYSDLLLYPDLPVTDSYYTLVEKSTSFMRYAHRNFQFRYLLMLDDDVYLRPAQLIEGLRDSASATKFYAGQVWATQ